MARRAYYSWREASIFAVPRKDYGSVGVQFISGRQGGESEVVQVSSKHKHCDGTGTRLPISTTAAWILQDEHMAMRLGENWSVSGQRHAAGTIVSVYI